MLISFVLCMAGLCSQATKSPDEAEDVKCSGVHILYADIMSMAMHQGKVYGEHDMMLWDDRSLARGL